MKRICHQRCAEEIEAGLDLLPPIIKDIFRADRGLIHFFVGDPVFAGLEKNSFLGDTKEFMPNDAAHALYAHNQLVNSHDAVPTIVFPKCQLVNWQTVLHEAGHMAHLILDFEDFNLPVVSDYARTNHIEAFAEAFVAWVVADSEAYAERFFGLNHLSRDDMRLFDAIILDNENRDKTP